MAIFSNKIVTAKFIDSPNNMIIELLYQEDDKVIPYTLEVDFTNQDFNDLLEEITLDEIEKNTNDILKAEAAVFNEIINNEIERRWDIESEKIKKAYEDIDSYAKKRYNELDQYAEKKYNDLDEYAEQEKLKKFEEVQTEFSELRRKLQEKFVGNEFKSSGVNGKDLLDIINSKDKDDDFVFNFKVSILEDPEISKSKDKSLKLSIRKSKSIWELLKLYTNARF